MAIGGLAIIYGLLAYTSQKQKAPVRDEAVHYGFGCALLKGGLEPTPNRGVGSVSILNALLTKDFDDPLESPELRSIARLGTIVQGMLLVIVSAAFSWKLFGPSGALLTAILVAFEPNLIAHGSLVTTDLPVSLGICSTLYFLFLTCAKPSIARFCFAGLALGFALAAKSTALILILLLPLYFCLIVMKKSPDANVAMPSHARRIAGMVLMIAIAWTAIACSYGLSELFRPVHRFEFHSAPFAFAQKLLPRHFPVPLPALYVQCLDLSFWSNEVGHPVQTYLFGNFYQSSKWNYFLAAFLVKSTAGFLLAIAILLTRKIFKSNRHAADLFTLLPTLIFFAYMSFFTHINIGLRYILPCYPLLGIAAGELFSLMNKRRSLQLSLGALILGSAIEGARIWPHYLEFFNFASGGPMNGYKYLNDSNLEWGQNLDLLKQYQINAGRKLIIHPDEPANGWIAVNSNKIITEKYQWLQDYRPIDRVAYTWFIYEIFDQADRPRDAKPKKAPGHEMKINQRLIGPEFEKNSRDVEERGRPVPTLSPALPH
jgi:4-amino-4-deoxy-L-arabinose transferase-like glycosyltransferase